MDGNTTHLLGTENRLWGAIVIGAGPAGALAAAQLATRGIETLLVDGKPFPRNKVCGGCLSAKAVGLLEKVGLGQLIESMPAGHIETLQLQTPNRTLLVSVPGGRVILRADFDANLADRAVAAGAQFLDDTRATVLPATTDDCRMVDLNSNGTALGTVRAKVVLVCDGLAGSSLARMPFLRSTPAAQSRIGLGAVVNCVGGFPADRIRMAVHAQGYVGAVRLPDGRVNLAAAVAPTSITKYRPAELLSNILAACRMEVPLSTATAEVKGTAPLTRRVSRIADERLFLLGDAAGYIEPFTGEGMACALASALAVVPLVVEAQNRWSPRLAARWCRIPRQMVIGNPMVCRLLSQLCRRPGLLDLSMRSLASAPWLAAPVVHHLNRIPAKLEALC